MSDSISQRRGRKEPLPSIERDPGHHLAGPFLPQTPLDTPPSSPAPTSRVSVAKALASRTSFWHDIKSGRWIVHPPSSFRLLLIPIILHLNWVFITPLLIKDPPPSPFAPLLFISHPTPSPTNDETDPRYRKGWLDLVFIAYYIIVWSFVRQSVTIYICRPVALYYNIRKEAKLERFGEQGYAVFYFALFGTWGAHIMSMLPTWWYNTSAFWIDYPHWQMVPQLKAYYLVQAAYWCQQLIVMVSGLEKPRSDYKELVAHHFVTLWLIGWSYGINLTYIGNAIYMSMDIPDLFLAFSKSLNYMRYDRLKVVSFVVLMFVWTYFRHYLNLVALWSVYKEFDLMPETSKRWAPAEGVWMVWWMKWQIFAPILLLQFLNLFWYTLMWRIAWRAITESEVSDVRSDDEDEDEEPANKKKKN